MRVLVKGVTYYTLWHNEQNALFT